VLDLFIPVLHGEFAQFEQPSHQLDPVFEALQVHVNRVQPVHVLKVDVELLLDRVHAATQQFVQQHSVLLQVLQTLRLLLAHDVVQVIDAFGHDGPHHHLEPEVL